MKKVLCPNGVFFFRAPASFFRSERLWQQVAIREKTQRCIFFVLGEAIILTIFLSPMDHVVHPHLPDFKYKTERW